MCEKTDVRSLEQNELKQFIKDSGFAAYRADQIFDWMHRKCVGSFDEMTNIPKDLRAFLNENCTLRALNAVRIQTSKIDGTKKYLFELEDGNTVESVMMRYIHGNSVCVSSQVGCAMGCAFCASTVGGLVRNLNTSEILAQVYEIQKDIGERISNIVIMGMGEPLTNYDNVTRFIRMLSDEKALQISQRNITISTCGIVPAIKKLSEEDLKVTLALSLHAPNDEIRKTIMPVASRFSIDETLEACKYYFKKTGRRLTFEYCLINNVNDRPEHARELAKRLKGINGHVNLIPVNPNPDNDFTQTDEKTIKTFQSILENNHITVTRRREMGRDISGACGQLRRQVLDGK